MKQRINYAILFVVLLLMTASCSQNPVYTSSKVERAEHVKKKRKPAYGKRGSSGGGGYYASIAVSDASTPSTVPGTGNTPKSGGGSGTGTTSSVVKSAKSYLGTPYRLGGMSRKGIDCSALMVLSFKSGANYQLPRTTKQQILVGKKVSSKELKVGDLLFFSYPSGRKVTHVGMVSKVVSRNQVTFIHASTSKGVREDQLFSNYWISCFLSARRVL